METVELGAEVIMLAGSTNGGGMNVVNPRTGGSFDSSEDEQYSNRTVVHGVTSGQIKKPGISTLTIDGEATATRVAVAFSSIRGNTMAV